MMLKKILIYLLGNVLSRAIIFILLPVYSTYIVPEEYGYYDIVITYLSFITSSFCLEIWTTLLRFAIEEKDQASKYKVIQNAGVILSGSIFLILIAVLITHLCVDIEYAGLIMAYAFVLCSQNFIYLYRPCFRQKYLFCRIGYCGCFIQCCYQYSIDNWMGLWLFRSLLFIYNCRDSSMSLHWKSDTRLEAF